MSINGSIQEINRKLVWSEKTMGSIATFDLDGKYFCSLVKGQACRQQVHRWLQVVPAMFQSNRLFMEDGNYVTY